jgi:hypothetical protein
MPGRINNFCIVNIKLYIYFRTYNLLLTHLMHLKYHVHITSVYLSGQDSGDYWQLLRLVTPFVNYGSDFKLHRVLVLFKFQEVVIGSHAATKTCQC